jgi:hypothetical protein
MHLRPTLIGTAAAILAAVASVVPAAASSQSVAFKLSTDNDVTTVVACPQGTPTSIVMCGIAINIPLKVEKGLSGPVSESFASALSAPAPTADCAAAMATHSAITLNTARGDLFLVTSGSFCTVTGRDVEPFVIIGGTGDYKGATGSGTIVAQQTSPTSASETYDGTIILAH